MRVRFNEHAEQELDAASDYYLLIDPNLSDELISKSKKATSVLLQFPLAGSRIARGGFRRILLDRFPYQLIYRVESDEIVVYAVAHQKRRPGYWRKRVPPAKKS
jgi:toxin ParE1/3/4